MKTSILEGLVVQHVYLLITVQNRLDSRQAPKKLICHVKVLNWVMAIGKATKSGWYQLDYIKGAQT